MTCDFSIEKNGQKTGCPYKNCNDFFTTESDNLNWCPFHLPTHDKRGIVTEKSSWSWLDFKRFLELANFDSGQGRDITLFGAIMPWFVELDGLDARRIIMNRCECRGISFSDKCEWFSIRDTITNDRSLNFREACFNQGIEITNSLIKHGANFYKAQLGPSISQLQRVTFEGEFSFTDANVEGFISFADSTFCKKAMFDRSIFYGIDFEQTNFLGPSSFSDVKFYSRTYFRSARFAQTPSFQGCDFHPETSFDRAKFLAKPPLLGGGWLRLRLYSIFAFCSRKSADMAKQLHRARANHYDSEARAYRTLQRAMGDVRARVEEARFFALEQRALRKHPDAGFLVWIASALYALISDYGRSFIRPLCFTFLIAIFFCGFYQWMSGEPLDWSSTKESITLSVKQIVRPFWIWVDKEPLAPLIPNPSPSSSPPDLFFYQCIATLQSFVAISTIALFLLALRRRFKMD